MSTPEELPKSTTEQVQTPEELPPFIPEGDQEGSNEPKMEFCPMLKVKFLFHQKAKLTPESLKEESTSQMDAPPKADQEMVTISDEDGMTQEAPGPSTSQSTEVLSCKQCLEGQGLGSESSTPKKRATKEEVAANQVWSMSSGIKEEDLHPFRFETYSEDYNWVHHV